MYFISLMTPNIKNDSIEAVGYLQSPKKSYQIISLTQEELTLQEKRLIDSFLYLICEVGLRIAGIFGKQIQNPYEFYSVEEILEVHLKKIEEVEDIAKLDSFVNNFDQEIYKGFTPNLSLIKSKISFLKKKQEEELILQRKEEEIEAKNQSLRDAFLEARNTRGAYKPEVSIKSLPETSKINKQLNHKINEQLKQLHLKRSRGQAFQQKQVEPSNSQSSLQQTGPVQNQPKKEEVDLQALAKKYQETTKKTLEEKQAFKGERLSGQGKNLFYSAKMRFIQMLVEKRGVDGEKIKTVMDLFSREIPYSDTFAERILALYTTFCFIEEHGLIESFENRQELEESEFYKLIYASYVLEFKDSKLNLEELNKFSKQLLQALAGRNIKAIFTCIETYVNGENELLTKSFQRKLKAVSLLESVRKSFFSSEDFTEEEILELVSLEKLAAVHPYFQRIYDINLLEKRLEATVEVWNSEDDDLGQKYESLQIFIDAFYALALETFLKGKGEEDNASFQQYCRDFFGSFYTDFSLKMSQLNDQIQNKTPSFRYIDSTTTPWIATLKNLTSIDGGNKLQTVFSCFGIEVKLHSENDGFVAPILDWQNRGFQEEQDEILARELFEQQLQEE